MNVASLELCKELYELSGWEGTYLIRYQDTSPNSPWVLTEAYRLSGVGLFESIPAYDLGHLLRELEPLSKIKNLTESYIVLDHVDYLGWRARLESRYDSHKDRWIEDSANTPEDAAAKLAIELFKQGVLK